MLRLLPNSESFSPLLMSEIESCHFLDATSVPGAAFSSALGRLLPTTAWLPRISIFAVAGRGQSRSTQEGSIVSKTFALQRGYNHEFLDRALGLSRDLEKRLLDECHSPAKCLLICTSPHWTPVAERWPGPVAYYSLDFTYAYAGASPSQILSLDKRLCRASTLVFSVSRRIGEYLIDRAGCDPGRVVVLPNATLSENIQSEAAPPMPRPAETWPITSIGSFSARCSTGFQPSTGPSSVRRPQTSPIPVKGRRVRLSCGTGKPIFWARVHTVSFSPMPAPSTSPCFPIAAKSPPIRAAPRGFTSIWLPDVP